MKPASTTTWPAIQAWIGVASAAALLSACGGGSSPAAPAAAGKNSVAFALQVSAPVATCANGGITVQSGIDTNANGVLDDAEVSNTAAAVGTAPMA